MWLVVLKNFLNLSLELTVLFFAVSLVINLMQQFIPYDKVEYFLNHKNPVLGGGVAVVFAFVTPFCSCSTIPLVVNMLQKKMRFAIVMIFLFTSPVLDPTIVTLMGFLLGWKIAVIYTVVTSVLGISIGFILEHFGFERSVKQVVMIGYQSKVFQSARPNLRQASKETLALIKTVYPYLIIGAAIGSIIQEAVPTQWVSNYFGGSQWWLVPIAAVVGIPLYIRLTTMIPISQILIAKGMALGPVMALLVSSAGASLPEITLLNSIFKKELVLAFLLSVFGIATLSGTIFYFI